MKRREESDEEGRGQEQDRHRHPDDANVPGATTKGMGPGFQIGAPSGAFGGMAVKIPVSPVKVPLSPPPAGLAQKLAISPHSNSAEPYSPASNLMGMLSPGLSPGLRLMSSGMTAPLTAGTTQPSTNASASSSALKIAEFASDLQMLAITYADEVKGHSLDVCAKDDAIRADADMVSMKTHANVHENYHWVLSRMAFTTQTRVYALFTTCATTTRMHVKIAAVNKNL
jgi:hypothetical protein